MIIFYIVILIVLMPLVYYVCALLGLLKQYKSLPFKERLNLLLYEIKYPYTTDDGVRYNITGAGQLQADSKTFMKSAEVRRLGNEINKIFKNND